jgi:hypothetical protein
MNHRRDRSIRTGINPQPRTTHPIRSAWLVAVATSIAFGSPIASADDSRLAGPDLGWSVVASDGARRTVSSWSLSTGGDRLERIVPSEVEGVDAGPVRRLPIAVDGASEVGVRTVGRVGVPVLSIGSHLLLQSGERLPGRPDLVDGELVWRHAWLGDFTIDLDTLRSLVMSEVGPPPESVATSNLDVVTLANGDRVEGFVTEVAGDVLVESIEDGSQTRVPFERVSRIDLVAGESTSSSIRVWTRDGTVVDVEALRGTRGDDGRETEADLLAFERSVAEGAGRGEGVVFTREVVAIAWRPDVIMPLDRCEFEVLPHAENADRPWLPAPRRAGGPTPFGAATIELIGPARFRTKVPKGSILSADVELPALMRRFGDVELRILDGTIEVLRRRFSRESPQASISVPIESGDLTIELGPGLRGPVQDRLRFTTPMLLRSSS